MSRHISNPDDFIAPLNMNGLKGRMLYMPPKKDSNLGILLVYGHHSSLEQWWGMSKYLNHYGSVTMPDLPGFGGMESFYKIGKKPTIDNLADYLASFMKLRYKRKKVAIIGVSFGFAIVTRMLQRYPELLKNVEMIVSLDGFAHADDFTFTRRRKFIYKSLAFILSLQFPALIFRYAGLNGPVLSMVYRRYFLAKDKSIHRTDRQDLGLRTDAEVWLWQHNDLRTYARTMTDFLMLDNCRKNIDLPVWQIFAEPDQYFDHNRVYQHMSVVFTEVFTAKSKQIIDPFRFVSTEQEASKLVPPSLRHALNQL